jgi:hypothetical protein
VGSTFGSRQLDLAKAMRDASSTIAPGHLKDFDWKVQVRACVQTSGIWLPAHDACVAGILTSTCRSCVCVRARVWRSSAQVMLSSDKMSEIRQPVLSLKMDVGAPGGAGAEKSIVVEMTKEEADKVLRSMDAAYQHMEKLKA